MKPKVLAESRNNKEACTPTARPSSSLVRIDSISINIDAAEQSKSEKCDQFTIRGLVSDIRKKNGKLCWPFAADGDDASSEDINSRLPPLETPKFKWWRCQNCLSDIDAAAASDDVENIATNCGRPLKTKSSRSCQSLENVVAYLSKKLEQPLELGGTQCKGSEFTSEFTQKQRVDLALGSSTRRLEENELHGAENGFFSNQTVREDGSNHLVTLTHVYQRQKQSPKLSKPISSKFGIADSAKHQRQDDSSGTGRRKTKKVRLLNELFDKDGKGALPALTEGDCTGEAAKVSSGALQSLQQIQKNLRCQKGHKKNKKCQEQDNRHSQMHKTDSVVGKDGRKVQDINGKFADREMHMTSNEGRSDAVIKRADKMLFGSKKGSDWHKNYQDRGQKTNSESCRRQEHMSMYQPFHGRVTGSLPNDILPSSQFKGKSNDTINKVCQGANVLALADNNSKELEGNSVPKKLLEKIQIGHQTQSFQSIQDEYSSKSHYLFSDGCLDTRKGIGHWVPQTENGNLRNDLHMQYMEESSSMSKSLATNSIWQETTGNSSLKRPNLHSCEPAKKPKSARIEGGPTVVHRTELLIRNSSKKMVGSPENPEITLSKFRDNMMQEFRTPDDIPMDIVELLAKNQYERHLHEAGDNHYMRQSGSNPKNDLMGNSNVLSNVVSRAAPNEKLHSPKAWISEKDSKISNIKSNGYIMQGPSTGGTYSPLLSSQGGLSSVFHFPAAGASKTDSLQICKYDMNQSASEHKVSFKSQSLYEAWQPTSRQSDKTVRDWPMIPHNYQVHMSSALQGSALQPFDVGKMPKGSSYVSEVRDFNNLSLADVDNRISDFRLQKSHASRPNRVDNQPQLTGTPDTLPNETIPAMHLLSLMGGSLQSSTPINMDASANRKTFDKSFSNDHLAKELSENNFGVGKSCHQFKQPPPYGHHSKVLHSDVSCQCSHPVPIFGSVVTPLPGDVGNIRVTQPLSQHPERNYLSRNAGGPPLPNENKGFKYQKSRFCSVSGVTGQEPVPALELSNHMFSPPWSVLGASHPYVNGNLSNYYSFVSLESYETLRRRPDPGACYVNRNPSEFTIPGPGNEYMIGAEELKRRNRSYPPNITRPVAINALSQQRNWIF
uniref:Embryonic flower 1-like protein n=2 Tax=Kalanchoe fedtschenkoi TaxID=63787 RepID=A0A7N0RHP9_KALFE